MNRTYIEYCAHLAEIVGAVAVVISVIYLAVQISDNTVALQTEGHFNAVSLAQRPLELLIADQELSEVIATGYSAPEQLSAADWQRFAMYQVMAFNAWEYLYYAHHSNSIPENLWAGADAYYRGLLESMPGLLQFWSEYRHIFDKPFQTYAESVIGDSAAMPVK